MKKMTLSKLSFEYKDLILKALQMREMAYAPYSKLRVGAALLDVKGQTYLGCNIENASSAATICAERVALTNAVSQGSKEFLAIAIASSSDEVITPCGICRQTLSEFGINITILCANDMGEVDVYELSELFPQPFTF